MNQLDEDARRLTSDRLRHYVETHMQAAQSTNDV